VAAILRKIRADLLNRRLATALVTLTILASAALLTLTVTTLNSMSDSFERTFAALNGAHLWLYFNRDVTSRSDVARVEELPGVAGSTGLRVSHTARAELGAEHVLVSLRQMEAQQPSINALLITAGRYLTADDARGVVMDKRLAERFGVQPGDTVLISTDTGDWPLQVVGLAFNPTWDIYRTVQPPYLYVLEKTFTTLFPDPLTWDWSVGLRLADPNAVKEMLAAAQSATRRDAVRDSTDWREVRRTVLFDTQLNTLFLTAFGRFALAASAFIITNSISGAVLAQFRDIGVLKALGFTGAQVAWVYLGQNLIVGAMGGGLGIALGAALAPLPLASLAHSLNTTPRPAFDLLLLAGVWRAIQCVVLLATLWPARSGARVNTIRAITTGYELAGLRPSRLAWLARALRLPMPMVLGAKDAFARRGRAALTLLSLLLGVVSLVFSFELNAVLNIYLRDPSLAGMVYNAAVSRNNMSDNTARRTLEQAPGVEGMFAHVIAQAKTADGKSFRLRAEEGDLSRFPFKLDAGRLIDTEASGEVMIGAGLQTWLGLNTGDTLRVTVNDKRVPAEWTVVGVYREPTDLGQMATISLRSLRAIDRTVEPDTYYLRLAPEADAEALRAFLKEHAGEALNLAVVNTQVSSLVQFRLTMLALSAALAVIALVSVFNSAVLNMRERMAEVGTFKTLGMTPAQVVAMVLTSGGTLGVLAALVGVPLGVWLVQFSLTTLGKSYGQGAFEVQLDWVVVLGPALVAVLVSLLGSAVPARWAARLNVVQVLQYE